MMPEETPSPPQPRGTDSLAFGGFLVMASVLILVFARDIDAVDRGNHDPGPQAVPITLGVLLLAGGVYQLAAGWFARRQAIHADQHADQDADQTDQREEEPPPEFQPHSGNVLITIAALAGYVWLLPVLGFSLATVLFAGALLWRFGSSWWGGLLAAVLLTAAVKLVFALLFKVPLPAGQLGLPF